MVEDKLTRCERIRLECFAQACHYSGAQGKPLTLGQIFDTAQTIETWLLNSNRKMN